MLLVVEDLHWLDTETQAILDSLVEIIPTARILLLVNFRPEYSHTWGNKGYFTQIRIDPLGQVSAEQMLDALLGDDPTVQPLKPLLIRRTEGTPLFLEESVRSLIETGALIGEPGALRLVRAVEDVRVPATVQAVLAARIDRLPSEEKRLLQTAAVLGKDVPFTLLEAIADRPDADLRAGLARLQAAELLYPTSVFPSLELTFKHALTHDVAYGSLLQDRRKSLHAGIVTAIERLYGDRRDEQVERLAHHALAAEDWTGALHYCGQAGDKMNARAAYREAAAYFERALSAFERLADKDDRLAEVIDVLMKLRNAVFSYGDIRGGLTHLMAAERLADRLGDQRRLASISILLSSSLANLGQTEHALRAAQRALAIAEDFGDVGLTIGASDRYAASQKFAGDFREAAAFLRRNVTTLTGPLRLQTFGQVGLPAVTSRGMLAESFAELGEFDAAMTTGAEAVQVAEAAEHPYSITYAYGHAGYPHLVQGDLAGAVRYLEHGLRLAQINTSLFPNVARHLGYAYVLAGRVGDGLTLLRRVADQLSASGHVVHQPQTLVFLTHGHLLLGELELAATFGQQALAHAQACEQPLRQADALRVLGEIAARQGPLDADTAERHLREALSMAERLEMRPLQAHCRLGLGKLYRRLGRLSEVRAELTAAIVMLREMGMTLWLPEAEAELTGAGA